MFSYEEPIGGSAKDWSLYASHFYCWMWYIIIFGVSCIFVTLVEMYTEFSQINNYPLYVAAIGDILSTVFIWISAIIVNNSSMYDVYWSVFTPVVIIYWFVIGNKNGKDVPTGRIVLIFLSVWTWAIRLTSNWIIGWTGFDHEDWRYVDIREGLKKKGYSKLGYWFIGSLLGIMIVPTLMVFASSIPLYPALYTGVISDGAKPLNFLDFLASFICVSAAVLQWISDRQMRLWRLTNQIPGACMEEGLWRYSRHPNYFGEICFWWGIYFHALASKWEFFYTIIGAIIITLLFVYISIPLMEERSLKKRPQYKETIRTTSMIIPLPKFNRNKSKSN